MNTYYEKNPIRVPVKFVKGKWEFFYGGEVPIREGTTADLVLERHCITDQKFLADMQKPSVLKMLDGPIDLMVSLTIKTPLEKQHANWILGPNEIKLGAGHYSSSRSAETRFFPIRIGEPTPAFVNLYKFQTSGVWLSMEGMLPKGLIVSSIEVPKLVLSEPLLSLNHALTKLSEIYEPWRKSHTGNIYSRVLYQEENDKWYPIEALRDAAKVTAEQTLIKTCWKSYTPP